jgi:hypothetical protein
MFAISFVHLIVAPHAFDDAFVKGLLFVALAICALIAAAGIQEGEVIWGWGMGALIACLSLAGYLANLTVGLPGLPAQPGVWQEPLAVVALAAEGLMVVTAAWTLYADHLAARRVPRHQAV